MLESVQWKCRILPNIINNLNFFKNGFKKKSAFGGFGLEGFWIAHTIYLMDFGVPKMGFLVLVLGVIERGVVGFKQAQMVKNGQIWAEMAKNGQK